MSQGGTPAIGTVVVPAARAVRPPVAGRALPVLVGCLAGLAGLGRQPAPDVGRTMMTFPADLHIHTALSPCAAAEMTPPAIVRTARERGLALIAVCDHNAAGNAAATVAAGRRLAAGAAEAVTVIAGMEITTAEEAHLVALFPGPDEAEAAAAEVAATLPEADEAYYKRFGPQLRMDAEGRVIGSERRMLAMASAFELSQAVKLVHRHGGIALAAHVNRPSFSVLSQLGVFPANAGIDAIELFVPCGSRGDEAAAGHFQTGLPVLASSDAHYLDEIGRARTVVRAEAPTFAELACALRGVGGRGVRHA